MIKILARIIRNYCIFRPETPVLVLLMGCVFLALAGCQSTSPSPRVHRGAHPSASVEISIHELARELGLTVVETNDTYVKLANAGSTVLIFSYSNGQFYVNGDAKGSVGKARKSGEELYVESSLVQRLRSHLGDRPAVARVPQARARKRGQRGLVVVDPGHGGKDPGATSVLGFPEKDINLNVGLQLAENLEQRGFQVIMTRDTDHFISLEERAAIANRQNADLFISVHADYCATPSITGFTIYTAKSAAGRSRQAAQAVKQALLQDGQQTRGVREADYRVLVQTRCPAILVELGYLSNYWESRRLRDSRMQERLAQAIAAGTEDLWAGLGDRHAPTVAVNQHAAPRQTYSAP